MKKKIAERHYLRAYELVRILMDYPHLKVGIKTNGKYKHSPVNHTKIMEWNAKSDDGCLITSEDRGRWLLLDFLEVKEK